MAEDILSDQAALGGGLNSKLPVNWQNSGAEHQEGSVRSEAEKETW
jgi:hypothetical protein